jgi:hypothetical protein
VSIKNGENLVTFQLVRVPNRFKFVVKQTTQPPIILPAYLENVYQWGFNTIAPAIVVSPTQFQWEMNFPVGGTVDPNYLVDSVLNSGLRITGAVDIDTFLNSYTKEGLDQLWCCAVLDDYVANKDRANTNDAFSSQGRRGDFWQQVIGAFSVYVVVPNKGNLLTKTNGRAARDLIEDVRLPLMRSVLGHTFQTDLSSKTEAVVIYAGDGFYQYTGAYYVHRFQFQQTCEITVGDTNDSVIDRAFRDIHLQFTNAGTSTQYFADVNLDDEPVDQSKSGYGSWFGIF